MKNKTERKRMLESHRCSALQGGQDTLWWASYFISQDIANKTTQSHFILQIVHQWRKKGRIIYLNLPSVLHIYYSALARWALATPHFEVVYVYMLSWIWCLSVQCVVWHMLLGHVHGYHRIIARSILRAVTTVSITKGAHKFLFEPLSQEANPKGTPGVMNPTESSTFPLSLETIFLVHHCCNECGLFLGTKPPSSLWTNIYSAWPWEAHYIAWSLLE